MSASVFHEPVVMATGLACCLAGEAFFLFLCGSSAGSLISSVTSLSALTAKKIGDIISSR